MWRKRCNKNAPTLSLQFSVVYCFPPCFGPVSLFFFVPPLCYGLVLPFGPLFDPHKFGWELQTSWPFVNGFNLDLFYTKVEYQTGLLRNIKFILIKETLNTLDGTCWCVPPDKEGAFQAIKHFHKPLAVPAFLAGLHQTRPLTSQPDFPSSLTYVTMPAANGEWKIVIYNHKICSQK